MTPKRGIGLPAILLGPRHMPSPKSVRKRHVMTVGIGVSCQKGTCVVMAADGKGSFPNGEFPSHERIGKQHDLPFRLCGNFAGSVEICNAIMNRIASALEAHPRNVPIQLDYVLNVVESARFSEFKRLVDGEMKKRLAVTLEEWQQMPEPTLLYRRGNKLLTRSVLPVELLVGGMIYGSATVVHFGYMDIARVDNLACIGTGGDAAFGQLMKRSQEAHMSLPRTILHVAEAMQAARLENPDTVGAPTDFVVITERQTRRMPAKSPVLAKMLEKYANADNTEEIDSSNEIWNVVQAAMYIPGISKEEYDKGIRSPQQRATLSASQKLEDQQ